VIPPIGIPDSVQLDNSASRVVAYGWNLLAAGATTTASGADAEVIFEGDVATAGPHQGSFVGDYKLTLAGLNQQTTRWEQRLLYLLFSDLATPNNPNSYISCGVNILNNHFYDVEIVPTTTKTNHHRYGTSQVTVTFHTTSGTLFGPTASGSGAFVGSNFESDSADYNVSFGAGGTPISLATAAPDGQVVLILPEGTYTFNPTVESVNPGGTSSSHNTLLPFTLVVSPCAKITTCPELQSHY
jgi:hypothetical protein